MEEKQYAIIDKRTGEPFTFPHDWSSYPNKIVRTFNLDNANEICATLGKNYEPQEYEKEG